MIAAARRADSGDMAGNGTVGGGGGDFGDMKWGVVAMVSGQSDGIETRGGRAALNREDSPSFREAPHDDGGDGVEATLHRIRSGGGSASTTGSVGRSSSSTGVTPALCASPTGARKEAGSEDDGCG